MQRIVSIDAFRGLMLLGMTYVHLLILPFIHTDAQYPWGVWLAYSPYGFISIAEGFFFFAGLFVGLGYANKRQIWPSVKGRITKLYGANLAITLLVASFVFFSRYYHDIYLELHNHVNIWIDQPGIRYFLAHPWFAVLLTSVGLYNIPFSDILHTYIVFLFVSPLIVKSLKAGRVKWVGIVTIALWICGQYMGPAFFQSWIAPLFNFEVKLGWFNLFSMQLVFVVGIVIGFYHKQKIEWPYRKIAQGLLVFFVGALLLFKATNVPLAPWTSVGYVRLLIFTLKLGLYFSIRKWIHFSFLALIGRHSLVVYLYHIVLVYTISFAYYPISALPLALKIGLQIGLTFTIAIPAYLSEKSRSPMLRAT